MSARFRVISIGAIAAHPLWGEKGEVRAAHATTTLVESGDARILVDPSLPDRILIPRLQERAGIAPDRITHIFLTAFHPMRRRGGAAFPQAQWLVAELERELVGRSLVEQFKEARDAADSELAQTLRSEIDLLQKCHAAPDHLAAGVDLFPLPGVSPGSSGLLLPTPRATVLVAGDAVATAEHLEQGSVLSQCFDIEQARESLKEAVEIADLIICGRDNLVVNPARRPF